MSSAFIGGFGVDVIKGTLLPGAPPNYTLYQQGGVNNYGVVFGGYKCKPATITTIVKCASHGVFLSLITSYNSLIKTQCAVVDQFGYTYVNVLVLNVDCYESVDGMGNSVMTAHWLMLPSGR